MNIIDDLTKACSLATEAATSLLKKSQTSFDFSAPAPNPHHKAYSRTNASGTVSQIAAKGTPKHEAITDPRAASMHAHEMTGAMQRGEASPEETAAAHYHAARLNFEAQGRYSSATSREREMRVMHQQVMDRHLGLAHGIQHPHHKEMAISQAAMRHHSIETLETRNSDSLDFHETSGTALQRSLTAAYIAGGGKHTTEKIAPHLERIAKKHFNRDFTRYNNDSKDFSEHGVWRFRDALSEAYDLGKKGSKK